MLNSSDKRVGIRIPDSGFIRKLISALNEQTRFSSIIGNNVEHSSGYDKHDSISIGGGHPLVLTSANLSGQPSAIQIEVCNITVFILLFVRNWKNPIIIVTTNV